MSLINKVLIDLDKRQSDIGLTNNGVDDATTLNNLSYAPSPQQKQTHKRAIIITFSLVSVAVVALAGYVFSDQLMPKTPLADVQPQAKVIPHKDTVKSEARLAASHKPQSVPRPSAKRPTSVPAKTSVSHTDVDVKVKQAKQFSKQVSAPQQAERTDEDFSKRSVPLSAEQRAELAYQRGYDALKASQLKPAERVLRQALAIEPSHIKARELLSGIYIKQGRWIEASEVLRYGLLQSPRHVTFSKLYARTLMELKRDKQAISVLQKHAPALDSDPEYFAILAALYQRQANHPAAAKTYSDILKLQPANGVWWVGLGISLEAMGDNQRAGQAYREARKSGNLHNEVARFTNNRLVALDEIGFPPP